MRKPWIAVLILAGAVGAFAGANRWMTRSPAENLESGARAAAVEDKPVDAPEFPEGIAWVQSKKPVKLADLRGKVVVVHFWTFGCINCIHNYPVYKDWQTRYADKGLTILGVHTPEFQHEADIDRVRAKAQENGLKFPIAIDNDSRIWKKWQNQYWPAIYLIDKQGRVRYRWDGELHPDKKDADKRFAAHLDELLAEKP